MTNTGNQTLENVEITDTLNAAGTISNIQGADSKQDGKVTIFTISSLAPKAEATTLMTTWYRKQIKAIRSATQQ